MGPTLKSPGRIVYFMGVKGGVGCSTLASLLARLAAKRGKKVAFVDSAPPACSLAPAYLSLQAGRRHLLQLEPYREQLTSEMAGSFFPHSPEGVAYAAVKGDDETPAPFSRVFPLLEGLGRWFDYLFVDLASFPHDQLFPFLEKAPAALVVASPDPSALAAARPWQKRLLAAQFHLPSFGLLLNHPSSQKFPPDTAAWAGHFALLGEVPFLGEDLSLRLFEGNALSPALEKSLSPLLEKVLSAVESRPAPAAGGAGPAPLPSPPGSPGDGAVPLEQVHLLHRKLLDRLRETGFLKDQKNGEWLQRESLEPHAREILAPLIQELQVPDRDSRQRLVTETLNLAFGLGPLEPLLQDEEITEIMVNGPSRVYTERKGLLEPTPVRFLDEQQLRTTIERILSPIGRRIDESQPYVDGRLPDGSRVNAVIPPLSLDGPVLTIRKFSRRKLTVEDLVRSGSLTREAADFLGACVKARKNIVVSGGTGSGKTTLLNILSNFIPSGERIVTIEDSAELRLSQDHVVRLEGRPANLEGKGQVSIRDLVINALRMRPDRIVVGECRGGEALDMLQAMNTGHDGSLTTAHANSPRDVLSRLETMCLFTGLDLPLRAVREQISRAVHLVVQQSRMASGRRAVTQVSEVQGMEGEVIVTQDIFVREGEEGLVRRPFAPSFLGELEAVGYQWPGRQGRAKAEGAETI